MNSQMLIQRMSLDYAYVCLGVCRCDIYIYGGDVLILIHTSDPL
jgi:hypothetical protein